MAGLKPSGPRAGTTFIRKNSREGMSKQYHKVLTIAGSDSGGGAGIQADLKTFSALGCFGMSAITALTAQNTQGVTAIHGVPREMVGAQIDAIFNDMGADAVKIGMLFSADIVNIVADKLLEYRAKQIVLDPVMVAQSGDKLLQEDAIAAIKSRLIPMADVITPNLPEAAVLLERNIEQYEEMARAARDLADLGPKSVLLKGGHLRESESNDLLYIPATDRFIPLEGSRIDTKNTHGTGCTLSSALAAFLAKGLPLEEAGVGAKRYILQAIGKGAEYRLGRGHGPVHHFFEFWN